VCVSVCVCVPSVYVFVIISRPLSAFIQRRIQHGEDENVAGRALSWLAKSVRILLAFIIVVLIVVVLDVVLVVVVVAPTRCNYLFWLAGFIYSTITTTTKKEKPLKKHTLTNLHVLCGTVARVFFCCMWHAPHVFVCLDVCAHVF